MILWRDTEASARFLIGATVAWVLLEWKGLHALFLLSRSLMVALTALFVLSNAKYFVERSYLKLPELRLPEEWFLDVAEEISHGFNWGVTALFSAGSGKDLKKFLLVITCSWILSIVGSRFTLLTILYSAFIIVGILPAIYERYEDRVDFIFEKADGHFNKHIYRHYSTLKAKAVRKVSHFSSKKQH